ncbi:MAG: TAXI family TRAP transporter solute-binding subunit [Rhodocyclaceae bacterium]|nr:TAXI family TRAP transporter solute-binding subunit [Rhodocyclaceae bacterium]MCA3076454.1 TAXI family TRAP transporter solute-binding subunit [Rhodocyclaceae bacterium]MCA3090229.1 TAXI family TRAP transporter solute-binding subunit [Rhodocyclaceae bacterium]MCA3093767.1 TAXI family TRAP transporter solute-binding subunit [Rhodocyclaceae bacterium]MCA3098868.1 TAXI family TRAP transporter solute-binding subunit [Rhodocyclaceae bacterium]
MKRLIAMTAAVLVALSASVFAQPKAFSIVTGTTGGVYFPLGGGLAQLLNKHAGINANVEATAGSAENMYRIGKGQADLAFSQTDAAWDAVNGLDKFSGNKMGIRALMVLYPNAMHLVTIEGSGINSIADLRGKRVSTGPANSATEIMAMRAMQAVGIDPDKDVKRARLSPAESTRAIRDRQLDAYWFVGGVPTPAITDLAATPGIKIKLIDYQKEALAGMVKTTGPIYVPLTIPAKSYPGQDTPAQAVAVWNILAVRDDMPVEMAYNITRAAYQQRAELAAVHPEGRNIDIKWQLNGAAVIPFHPGAMKFWAEQGVKLK